MQEFSTVIASSYDAESLAPMLTEKAADGWSIVSIVSAGTNVIAYITRGGDPGSAAVTAPSAIVGVADVSNDAADAATDDGVPMAADTGAMDDAMISTPEPMPSTDFASESNDAAPEADQGGWGAGSTDADAPAMATDAAQASADDQLSDGMGAVAGGAGSVADTGDIGGAALSSADLTDLGDGGSAADAPLTSIGTDDSPDTGDATAALAGGVGDADPVRADDAGSPIDDGADTSTESVDGAAEHAGAPAGMASDDTAGAATEEFPGDDVTTEEAAPADASGVPAGWYADPSGRYELRYWDGAAWTEHVSRAGQQYTDPPVA